MSRASRNDGMTQTVRNKQSVLQLSSYQLPATPRSQALVISVPSVCNHAGGTIFLASTQLALLKCGAIMMQDNFWIRID